MVYFAVLEECERGEHDKCPEEIGKPGEIGGCVCKCPCHGGMASATSIEELGNLFWAAIKDSRNPSDFELYLEKLPDGPHVEEARRRLAELTKG